MRSRWRCVAAVGGGRAATRYTCRKARVHGSRRPMGRVPCRGSSRHHDEWATVIWPTGATAIEEAPTGGEPEVTIGTNKYVVVDKSGNASTQRCGRKRPPVVMCVHDGANCLCRHGGSTRVTSRVPIYQHGHIFLFRWGHLV